MNLDTTNHNTIKGLKSGDAVVIAEYTNPTLLFAISKILPKGVSKKEYCEEKINRTGMKRLQSGTDRNKIWAAVEAIFSESLIIL